MPNNGNLNFFELRLEMIDDAIVAMKQFAPHGITKFRNNSPQLGSLFKQSNFPNDLLAKILCGQGFVFGNEIDDLI